MILLFKAVFRTRPTGGFFLQLAELWQASNAVLFDFDGVLADSEPLYRKSWNIVLSDFDHSIPEEQYWKHWAFYGEGLAGEMKRTGLRVDNVEAAQIKQKLIYSGFCLDGKVPLFPLAAEVVRMTMRIKPCAIASNTGSELIRAIIGSSIYPLPPIIGGDGLRSKPFPDIFLKAASCLSAEPSECLVFEDAWKGVKAAVSAGMPAVLVRNNYNKGLSAPLASCELTGFEQLFLFLRGL
jgi:beta-phosphoglucomutase-like phosphatase (HAD superfamily)